jgi:F-type H+-transporting ATPase subunit gamma
MGSGVLKAIKRRIGSVTSTQQMAKAMQLVASSKLRKVEPKAVAIQPYIKGFAHLIVNHLKRFPFIENKFYQPQPSDKEVLLIGIGTDKGLCGNFNTLLLKKFHEFVQDTRKKGKKVRLILVGKKLISYAQKIDANILEAYEGLDDKNYKEYASKIVSESVKEFTGPEVGEVHLLFTKFYSTVKREAVVIPVLPFQREGFTEIVKVMEHVNLDSPEMNYTGDGPFAGEDTGNVFIYNPSPEQVFSHFAKIFTDMMVETALLESLTSEFSARMIAMKAASDNAEDMLKKLQLYYNRERQSSITMELADITGGAEALRNS